MANFYNQTNENHMTRPVSLKERFAYLRHFSFSPSLRQKETVCQNGIKRCRTMMTYKEVSENVFSVH